MLFPQDLNLWVLLLKVPSLAEGVVAAGNVAVRVGVCTVL